MSQLIPTDRPVLPRGNAKNDMSLWGGVVVGTSDFAPAPAKPERSNIWKFVAAGLALVVAGIGAFLIVSNIGEDKPRSTASKSVAPVTAENHDAAVAVATPDAAVVAVVDAGSDAAPTIVAVTGQVDAISGAAAIIKPKKKLVRKTTPKKAPPKKKVAPPKKK